MSKLHSQIARLTRPRLLIRAARIGLADYRRTRMLRSLLTGTRTAEEVVARLLEHEARAEAQRRASEAGYGVAHHVEILIALMAEARHLPRGPAPCEDDAPIRLAPPARPPCPPVPANRVESAVRPRLPRGAPHTSHAGLGQARSR